MLRQQGCPLLLAAAGACLALALLSAPALADNGVGCINDDGMYRDFIVAWKLPDGAEYVYFDPYMQAPQKSQYTLDSSTEGFLANTLNQVYSADKDKVGYVQYNDEWPDDHKHGTGGHAKGFRPLSIAHLVRDAGHEEHREGVTGRHPGADLQHGNWIDRHNAKSSSMCFPSGRIGAAMTVSPRLSLNDLESESSIALTAVCRITSHVCCEI